ncbi:MAG: FeoA family protein [Ignavibacteria bacterium]|jgi:Fe2+ transport system protein FeoA
MKTASELKYGEKATISEINLKHPSSRRILEVGFTPGEEIELMNLSIFNDPLAFAVRGTLIAIRKHEADCIIVS